jgi:hypothetical protein
VSIIALMLALTGKLLIKDRLIASAAGLNQRASTWALASPA